MSYAQLKKKFLSVSWSDWITFIFYIPDHLLFLMYYLVCYSLLSDWFLLWKLNYVILIGFMVPSYFLQLSVFLLAIFICLAFLLSPFLTQGSSRLVKSVLLFVLLGYSSCYFTFYLFKKILKYFKIYFFLGLNLWQMKFSRLGVELDLKMGSVPQPKQCQIWVTSTTYATACSNARSLNHWVRWEIKPTSSGTLCHDLHLLSHSGNFSLAF